MGYPNTIATLSHTVGEASTAAQTMWEALLNSDSSHQRLDLQLSSNISEWIPQPLYDF